MSIGLFCSILVDFVVAVVICVGDDHDHDWSLYLGSAVSSRVGPRAMVRPPRFHKSTKPSSLGMRVVMVVMVVKIVVMVGVVIMLVGMTNVSASSNPGQEEFIDG